MGAKKKSQSVSLRSDEVGELVDKTVSVRRVAKVVKGGRRFSFSALIVTGDHRGHIGVGLGKASEVPDAIRKASEQARKNLIKVPLRGSTIPHDVFAEAGASKVLLKPGAPGTGVIAGSVVRAIMDVAGVKDITTKCIGSSTAQNVVRAVFKGFKALKEPEHVAEMRGVSLEEMGYAPY